MVEESGRVIGDEREQQEELNEDDLREEFEESIVEKEKDKSERSRELGKKRKKRIEEKEKGLNICTLFHSVSLIGGWRSD